MHVRNDVFTYTYVCRRCTHYHHVYPANLLSGTEIRLRNLQRYCATAVSHIVVLLGMEGKLIPTLPCSGGGGGGSGEGNKWVHINWEGMSVVKLM